MDGRRNRCRYGSQTHTPTLPHPPQYAPLYNPQHTYTHLPSDAQTATPSCTTRVPSEVSDHDVKRESGVHQAGLVVQFVWAGARAGYVVLPVWEVCG